MRGFSKRVINTNYCSKLIFIISDLERSVIYVFHLALPFPASWKQLLILWTAVSTFPVL